MAFHRLDDAPPRAADACGRCRARRPQPAEGGTRRLGVLWTINHPGVYQLLAVERGWSPERYEAWLAELLCAQLLAGGDA